VRKLFLRHRRLIAIETVDGDHAAVLPIDARPDATRKLDGVEADNVIVRAR
jgi:hypothetical protein